nr:hypothetical protein [Tanacetum cinerariifolium]
MLLCKQEEVRFQLNAEQADWRDDTDDEPDDQELESHYMYMAQIQEVTPDAADNSRPIFDTEPLQKVLNNDKYNVFAIESKHPEQSKSVHDTYLIEQDEHNMIIDSLDMSYDREQVDQDDDDDDDDLANERNLLASLTEKLKCEIDDSKNRNKFLEISNKALVDKLKESRSKLSDLIRPFDYEKLNNLFDLFVPQHEKSSTQSLNAKTSNDFVCVTCGKCVLNGNHDMCVVHYLNGVNSMTKMPMAMPISTREPKLTVNQSVAKPLRRTVASESTNQKSRHTTRKLYEHVTKICSW